MLASERVGPSYIAAIPDFLKNRPAPFIQHCMTKIDLAETVEDISYSYLQTVLGLKVSQTIEKK